jgi:putative membrane protein
MRRLAPLMALALLLAAAPAMARTKHASPSPDAVFAEAAARSGLAEVSFGALAGKLGASPGVKAFGRQAAAAHAATHAELAAIAGAQGLFAPMATDAKRRAAASSLAGLRGAAFDLAYAAVTVRDHEETVALYAAEAARGRNGALRAFASRTLPALQGRLAAAKALAAELRAAPRGRD